MLVFPFSFSQEPTMAFSPQSLVRIANPAPTGVAAGNLTDGRQISTFVYSTDDAAAVVEAANYFNSATARLTKGSIIMASMVAAGTNVLKNYVVTSATGAATVTVALQTTTAG
jgi:hypothetical protein